MKVIKHKDKWYLQSETGYKEILLSTDTELTRDGVQAIDDDFLKWFVKNPSCEVVEVINEQYTQNYHKDIWYNRHKIIIPKEESKQIKCYCGHTTYCDCSPLEEPKQETVEEAIEKYAETYRCPATNDNEYCKHDVISAINFGAKWMQERMYSEEDLRNAYRWGTTVNHGTKEHFKEWFEQFKKK